jgi:hypothetical protein
MTIGRSARSILRWVAIFLPLLAIFLTGDPARSRAAAQVQVRTAPTWVGEERARDEISKGQYVFVSADGDNLILVIPTEVEPRPGQPRHVDPAGPIRILTVPFRNHIEPHLAVTVNRDGGLFRYTYDIENGAGAKDSITDWSVVVPFSGSGMFQMSHQQWHCLRTMSPIWRQVELPAITALGCRAVCLADNHRLEPGIRAKDFRILTELKPGFTTGEAQHFPPYEDIPPPPEVPDIVRSQLPDTEKYFLTIGPRFAPDTPDSIMAADYLAGIQRLVETARLDATSEFVVELEGLLGRFQNGESRTIMPKAAPHTELETEISQALRVGFNLP